jgi:hypothetical protein
VPVGNETELEAGSRKIEEKILWPERDKTKELIARTLVLCGQFFSLEFLRRFFYSIAR